MALTSAYMHACMHLLLWSLVNSPVRLVLYLGCMLCVSVWCAHCIASYATSPMRITALMASDVAFSCTKLADVTSPSNDYFACTHAVCRHVGASQAFDEMRKTYCFGETRLVPYIPSSSRAGKRIYYCLLL